MKIEELQERLQELNDTAQSIRAKAEAEKRDLSAEEAVELDRVMEDFDRTKANLERIQKLESQTSTLTQGQGRRTAPNEPGQVPGDDDEALAPRRVGAPGRISSPNARPPAEPLGDAGRRGGFRSLGEMAWAVRRACLHGGVMDPRLERLAAPTVFGNESSGADGGFAVPADFRQEIVSKVFGENSLVEMTDQYTSSSNTFTFPKDETSPWSTNGIQANWEGEGQLKTQSKPALETGTTKLNKCIALIPMTDELLEDAPAMDAYLRRKAPEKIAFKVNLAIFQGTGVGQPLGILNSGALVAVAKEAGQPADSITFANIVSMWSRLHAPSRATAAWFVNQDIEPALAMMSFEGTNSSVPVFLPAGGLSQSPYATLFGRPIIPTEALNPLGDQGDIVLADLKQYMTVTKAGGTNPKVDVSMHLWFDYDVTAFRFVLRIGGRPWWGSPVAPRQGNNTRSAYVALEERA